LSVSRFFSKRLVIFLCLALVVFVFAGCGQKSESSRNQQSQGQSGPQLVLKLAENQPEDYPTTIGDKEFARIVEEKTNGRIKIEVYAGGQLGDEKSVIEAVQMGGIDFARVNA